MLIPNCNMLMCYDIGREHAANNAKDVADEAAPSNGSPSVGQNGEGTSCVQNEVRSCLSSVRKFNKRSQVNLLHEIKSYLTSNRSNVNGRQWNENATPSTTIPLAGSTRLPPERKIQVRRHHIDNLIVVKELHPGTTTSRKSRRTTIRDIPHINFDEDGDDTTPIVFDKFSGISKDYFDHGDPTEECQECHALLWRAKSLRGNPNASKKSFSLSCFVSMAISSSWIGNAFA
ncbi:hypothetical protein Tco_0832403 [Tanacetum coccineum]